MSQTTQQIAQSLGITWKLYIPYRPQYSGKVEKAKSIFKMHLTKFSLELQRPWTEFLPVALACIRATPWALSFFSPFELMHGCPFLLGQFPASSRLLGEYLPTFNLIRPLVREHADHSLPGQLSSVMDPMKTRPPDSLPKPHQANPADLTLIPRVLLKTLYHKDLQPQWTSSFEVILITTQLLNWQVITLHFVKNESKSHSVMSDSL